MPRLNKVSTPYILRTDRQFPVAHKYRRMPIYGSRDAGTKTLRHGMIGGTTVKSIATVPVLAILAQKMPHLSSACV